MTNDLELREISEKIKKALKNSHISHNELAEKTKIPIGTLRSYLSGNRCPSYNNAVKIAECLGVGVGAFLSSEQKKHENKSKSDTFLRKNGVYVSLLRSLNYRCDVVHDDGLGIKCNISTKHLAAADDERYGEIVRRVRKYEAGLLPELTEDEIKKLYDDYYDFPMIHNNGVILDLDTDEWENLRKEIAAAVKEIVNKHIDAAVNERKLKQKDGTISDLLKTLTAVNALISSGSVDGEALEALHQLTDKYKL
jgi:transcriptional regulator with XRE-family HTH domain